MNYLSEKDIRDLVEKIINQHGFDKTKAENELNKKSLTRKVPVEISARHVHLTHAAVEALFGKGYQLKEKKPLSQPGQFLSEERVKVVTAKGEFSNVAVLGPERSAVQVEVSRTDARVLGIDAPVRLSGDLKGSASVVLIGPAGVYVAKESTIVAKAHIHVTPADAEKYKIQDGESLSVQIETERMITLNNVIARVSEKSATAMHIDFDEANACCCSQKGEGIIL